MNKTDQIFSLKGLHSRRNTVGIEEVRSLTKICIYLEKSENGSEKYSRENRIMTQRLMGDIGEISQVHS